MKCVHAHSHAVIHSIHSFTHSVSYLLGYSLPQLVTHTRYLMQVQGSKILLQVFCFICSHIESLLFFHLFDSFSLYPLPHTLNNFILNLVTCVSPWNIHPAFSQYISHASLFHLIWPKSYPYFKNSQTLDDLSVLYIGLRPRIRQSTAFFNLFIFILLIYFFKTY